MDNSNQKLILGTVQFGLDYGINNSVGKVGSQTISEILNHAYSAGVNYLDTAAAYGNAENVIGNYLNLNPDKRFKIITKLSASNINEWKNSLVNSLSNLQVNRVNGLLFHSFQSYESMRNTKMYDHLLESKNETFSVLGVSVYTNDELEKLVNDDTIDLVQVPFNILDNDTKRGVILRNLKEQGKVIHSRSVFLQGLFFMKYNEFPVQLKPLGRYLTEVNEIAQKSKMSLGELALKYSISKPYIDGVLVGVESLEQLVKNIQWVQGALDPEIVSRIDNINVEDINLLNPSAWKK
ncbi:MAG: aldo/keto reductase [Salibacteraceae bacterium]